MQKYQNRRDAGQVLANALSSLPFEKHNTIVLALPRGGVPVAYEVAKALDCRSKCIWFVNWVYLDTKS